MSSIGRCGVHTHARTFRGALAGRIPLRELLRHDCLEGCSGGMACVWINQSVRQSVGPLIYVDLACTYAAGSGRPPQFFYSCSAGAPTLSGTPATWWRRGEGAVRAAMGGDLRFQGVVVVARSMKTADICMGEWHGTDADRQAATVVGDNRSPLERYILLYVADDGLGPMRWIKAARAHVHAVAPIHHPLNLMLDPSMVMVFGLLQCNLKSERLAHPFRMFNTPHQQGAAWGRPRRRQRPSQHRTCLGPTSGCKSSSWPCCRRWRLKVHAA